MRLLLLLVNLIIVVGESAENPYERGCLFEKRGGAGELRVCNSEDEPFSDKCRQPYIDHLEIRIYSQNWESAFFETWLLQIILSEILDVPTTVETGTANASLNFYDPKAPFEYGTTDDFDALKTASNITDCRQVANSVPYTPCAHVIPEIWTSSSKQVKDAVSEGYIEVPQALGIVGQENWYMNKFAAQQDSTLDSYFGLQGEENRRKLAETFLRPTRWSDYCTQVSTSNCSIPSDVARRAPQNATEGARFFVEGLYTGHFRATAKNDCDANPTNCTGFVADFPCGWNSFVEAQTYHLNIALESEGNEVGSNGYTYEELLDIWDAANATRSPLMSMWWRPSPQYSKYLGTDAEFERVNFPPPTKECIEARVSSTDRCSLVLEERVGDPAGVCDEPANALNKILIASLRDKTRPLGESSALWSPAYRVLSSFSISDFQIDEIFDYWNTEKTPRDALCRWAFENLGYLESFLPRTYPRSVEEVGNSALSYVTIILGSITVVLVTVTILLVQLRRKKRAIRYAQVAFLRILLAGSLLIAIGAIVVGIPPTDASCIARAWLITLGYTLEIVPLIIKIAAINAMMKAAQRMRRTKIRMRNLFLIVAGISAAVTVFLIFWTVFDPPRRKGEYIVTQSVDTSNSTIVQVSYFCSSESDAWAFITVGWDMVLLICATVLAVQTRNLRQDFNESKTLAILVYSHFLFALLRVTTFLLDDTGLLNSTLAGMRSIMYSLDTIATIFIYFVPKLIVSNRSEGALSSNPPGQDSNTSVPTRTNTQTMPERVTAEERNENKLTGLVVDQGATNGAAESTVEKASSVAQTNQSNVPCRRCGYLEERDHLLEEGEPNDTTNDYQDSSVEMRSKAD